MENQLYRIEGSSGADLEFCLVQTTGIEPYKETREVGITSILGTGEQIDFNPSADDIKSLIKFLQEALEYTLEYNAR